MLKILLIREHRTNIADMYLQLKTHERVFTIDCGKPDIPLHGSVDIRNGTALNDTATFSCETGYTLANAAEETIEQVFGGMNIEILE